MRIVRQMVVSGPVLAGGLLALLVSCGSDPRIEVADLGFGVGEGASQKLLPPTGCVPGSGAIKSCSGGYCVVPGGCFLMGSALDESCRDGDEVQHWVALSHGFVISGSEVTQDEFKAVLGYAPSRFTSCGGSCPVDSVTWDEAAAYSNGVSTAAGALPCYDCSGTGATVTCKAKSDFGPGKTIYDCAGYRLPTEAEWEYSYRAGNSGTYYVSTKVTCDQNTVTADGIGWGNTNSSASTHPGAQKQPNAWGLFDMAGNVEEWVHDGYGPYPTGFVTDPVLPLPSASAHSARGGSWYATSNDMRGADRNQFNGREVQAYHGFRIVRSK